ncbi:hypothetical protein FHS57_005714 [Runella defluvii]|uniref:Uncharacterized protein n=1 Tax=Runella defluvii TaxID=370973 RepID=A0A7W5ZQ94_9BACT|nr:hypothetical protein [Runella defluvii]MBB3841685.1 hypothetical protein [Runella defluvii]HAK78814.1 hypothetical protein [Runella sp.]
MTQIILKNDIDQNKLSALLHFLKSFDIEVEVKTSKKTSKPSEEFSLTAGLWKDYELDANELRKQAWRIK